MALQPEQIEHINVVNWFNYQYPEYAEDLIHIANERRCSIQQGRTLKRMGVRKGCSDFFLAVPSPCERYHGLFLELKVGKGKLSQEQKEFLARKTLRGYMAVPVWGFDAAIEVIKAYLTN